MLYLPAEDPGGELHGAVPDLHGAVLELVDLDDLAAHGPSLGRIVDEVQVPLVVHGQVVREGPLLFPPQDLAEIFIGSKGPVGVSRVGRVATEAAVVVFDELGSEPVGIVRVVDAAEAQLLDEAVLERLVRALDPAFGLRGVGAQHVHVELSHGPGELGGVGSAPGRPGIDPEDAGLVAVERDGLAVLLDVPADGGEGAPE